MKPLQPLATDFAYSGRCHKRKGLGVVRKLGNKSLFPIIPDFRVIRWGFPMIFLFTRIDNFGIRQQFNEHLTEKAMSHGKVPQPGQ